VKASVKCFNFSIRNRELIAATENRELRSYFQKITVIPEEGPGPYRRFAELFKPM
jgi:hypothetical protein